MQLSFGFHVSLNFMMQFFNLKCTVYVCIREIAYKNTYEEHHLPKKHIFQDMNVKHA